MMNMDDINNDQVRIVNKSMDLSRSIMTLQKIKNIQKQNKSQIIKSVLISNKNKNKNELIDNNKDNKMSKV